MYVTERAVFKLTKDGLELIEVADGIDVKKDVLDRLPFEVIVPNKLKKMSVDASM